MHKLFLVLFLTCINVYSVFCMNLGNVREVIRYRIHDTTDTINNPRWSNAILNTRIDMKHREVCAFTDCLYTRALINPVTNQIEYPLPTDCRTIDRVCYQIVGSTGNYKRLKCYSLAGLDTMGGTESNTWQLTRGLPLRYYKRANYIGLNPAPGSGSTYPNGIQLDYWAIPYTITADTDTFYNNLTHLSGYEQVIINGVVSDIKRESGEDYASDFQEYVQWLNMMKDMVVYEPDRQDTIKIRYNDPSSTGR